MTKVLITGAAGFVGCHLATELSQRGGCELTLVDNFARGRHDDDLTTLLARPNVRLISADLSSPAGFAQLGTGYDHVYHLAAIIGVQNVLSRPWDVVRINALTTLHLLEWLRAGGGRKVLFSSTSEAYAWTQKFHELPIPTPEDVPLALTEIGNARSSYAGSKIFGELAVTHACVSAGLPFVNVRYHNVYGPRMGFEHVIPELFERTLGGENPLVVYSTHHSRAFCYISDAVTATIAAMETEAANGATINIGNDAEVTIGDLAQRILAKVNPGAAIEPREAKHDPILRRCPDISRARELLGFEPRVPLDEGLDKTFAWYRPQFPPPKMSDAFIPLCVPEIHGNEWLYVKDCLDTGWVSSVGSYVDRFEQMVAERAGMKFGVAAVNGTSALQISLLVAGVQPDDEVLVSTLTFIAPANTIRYVGAWPVFIDAEPDYWQMAPEKVAHFLEHECRWAGGELRNKTTGRRVSAIMPVHVLGHPAPMEALMALARRFQLAIIGDATESIGATCSGQPVAQWSDIACFSFNGNKLLTTGGGGVIVTNNEEWARRAKYLTTQAKDDPVEYIHHEIGYNHRLTNIQAAMGCAQMEQLDDYIAAKRRIAACYTEAFADLDGITPMREAPWAFSVFWMSTVLIDEAHFGLGWRALLAKLHEQKIQTRPLWQPLHLSRSHAGRQIIGGEVAERLYATALSLPCSVGLKTDDQERVIAAVRASHSRA